MAEALSVAASIAGLIQLADIVVGRGYRFIKAAKNAEKSVQRLVHETNTLYGVLHSLFNTIQLLEEDEEGSSFDHTTQVHYIESCYQTLSQIQHHLEVALPSTPLSTVDKIRWPLKQSQTKELLADIQRHKSTMGLAMSATEMSTLLKLLARQDTIQEGFNELKSGFDSDRAERKKLVIDEERLKMLDFLSKTDARKWQDSNIRLRQPGTGIWFTDGPEFKHWVSHERSKLWISGIAGAGKTVLISSIIQELEKKTDFENALAFFYCDYKDTATHNPLTILGTLARQLISQNEECFADLTRFYQDHMTNDHSFRATTPEELCDLIVKASAHFQCTMIVVDGLDEISKDPADISRRLQSINNGSNSIKTLFASRPEIRIGHALENCEKVSIAAMSSDLRLYVCSEIERRTRDRKLNIKDISLKEHIMKTLVEGADGMFRWVSCQMDYLCECSSDRDRRDALKQLPPDLPSSYERILERVNKSNKQNQNLVRNTLHWIVYAAESLTTNQLLQALAVQDGDTVFESSAMTTEEELLHWCSSLVRRNRSSGSLELAHFTVKEFLTAIDPIAKPCFLNYRLSDDHTSLAEACITFLKCKSFDGQPISSISPVSWEHSQDAEFQSAWKLFAERFEFTEYACKNWEFHLSSCKLTAIEEAVIDLFVPQDSPTFHLWTFVFMNSLNHKRSNMYNLEIPDPSPLHWAASLELDNVCEKLIKSGMDVNKESKFGKPLNCAILSFNAVDRVFRWGEKFTEFSESHSAPKSIIQMMLSAGAIIDVEVGVGEHATFTALELAFESDAYRDHPFATTVLLDAGCSVPADIFSCHLSKIEDENVMDWDFVYSSRSAIYLIRRFATKGGILLPPETHLEFVNFVLQILCFGCRMEEMPPGLSIMFEENFLSADRQKFNQELKLEDEDENEDEKERKKLTRILCRVLRTLSENVETAREMLQISLNRAVRHMTNSIVSILLTLNNDLNLSHTPIGSETTYLHMVLIDKDRYQPYHKRHIELLEILIYHGASIAATNEEVTSPLELSIAVGCNLNTFELLWNAPEVVSRYSSMDTTTLTRSIKDLLGLAITSNNKPTAEFLIKELSDRGSLSKAQWLDFLIERDGQFLHELLPFHVQGLDELYSDGLKSIHLAAQLRALPRDIQRLIEQQADISQQDSNGNTLLHILSQYHVNFSLENLQWLGLKQKHELDILNNESLTALALAVRCKSNNVARLLLDAGACPDTILAGGQTALHIACRLGNTEAVDLLLTHGSNVSHRDYDGLTTKDVALSCECPKLADTIQRAIDANEVLAENNFQTPLVIKTQDITQENNHGALPFRLADPVQY